MEKWIILDITSNQDTKIVIGEDGLPLVFGSKEWAEMWYDNAKPSILPQYVMLEN